ncbi:MAG: peroxiredoxin-like family protein [Pseudomonadota bacterium]|jgi:peroxiredoxin|uniref:peroxiredoxin-like family protein n=1 Tax=Sphingobium yanoikuyae TaxID=13690 RepID=UPI001376FF2B|nr:peroxiredoxin-like family protein [Sphingobium yanoikuyae]NBB40910.1 redoxin domain-containing protein [Sphingobium yanoikuyae]
MATIVGDNLRARYAALQAERERDWSPAQLARNAAQRQQLVARFDAATVAQPGDVLPDLALDDVEGATLTLDALTAQGPALLIFFRFAGCPACNIALPYYAETLWPVLRARGIPLVALSPQQPDRLVEIKRRHDLPFAVASDRDNQLARLLGIAFVPDDRPSPPPAGWIGEVTGTGSWELPQPAVLLLGPGRVVQRLQVSPDWLDRPEADDILAWLR